MKLDHLDPRMRPATPTPFDASQYVDEVIGGVLARQTEQAERERRLQKSIQALEKNVRAYINAIPQTDLAPVLGSVSQAAKAIQSAISAIKFPEYPAPERVDLSSVVQQIEQVERRLGDMAGKIDGIPTSLPEISVSTPAVGAVAMAAPSPRKWTHKVVRGPNGNIREIVSTAE